MTPHQGQINLVFLVLISLLSVASLPAQVLCLNCYNQNERILPDSTNMVLNGGFEMGCDPRVVFCPNSIYYDCDLDYWLCTGGGHLTYSSCVDTLDYSFVPEGAKTAYLGNYFSQACSTDSDTSCLQQTGCEVTGIPPGYPRNEPEYGGTTGVSIEQTVSGLTPGTNYELEFWAGGEAFPGMSFTSGLFAVDIGFGNIYLRDPATIAFEGIGIRYVILFRATSNSVTIRFTNWGHIDFNATELIIDDVRLMKSAIQDNPCSTSASGPEKDEYISIFPNPFQSSATIEFKSDEYQHAKFIVYDQWGVIAMYVKIVEPSTIIHREMLPAGIYFFQLILPDQKVQTGRFVIRSR